MRVLYPVAALALVVAACSQSATDQSAASEAQEVDSSAAATPRDSRVGRPTPPGAAQPMLAYVYSETVVALVVGVLDLVDRHTAACNAAGPSVCQVVGSQMTRESEEVTARLSLRAAPAWLSPFRQRLAADVRAAKGEIEQSSTETEDLTRRITDTDARVRAKTALRDRLLATLNDRPATVPELMDIEKRLTEAQGDLDATVSELAVMRQRAAAAVLNIDYRSDAAAGQSRPIRDALQSAGEVSATTIGLIIRLLAAVWPLAVLGGLVALAIHRVRQQPRKRDAPRALNG